MTFLLAYMLTGVIYLSTGLLYRPPKKLIDGYDSAILSLILVIAFSLLWVPAILVVIFSKLWFVDL